MTRTTHPYLVHRGLGFLLTLICVAVIFVPSPNELQAQQIPEAIQNHLSKIAKEIDPLKDSNEIIQKVQNFVSNAPNQRSKLAAIDFLLKKVSSESAKSALTQLKKQIQKSDNASPPQRTTRNRTIALKNITLLDGVNPPVANSILVFNRNKITHILKSSEEKLIPEKATVFDMKGAYITPGLIDVHVHMATNPSSPSEKPENAMKKLRRMFGSGITSVRDMGGDGRVLTFYKRQMKLGDELGPDIYFSTILAGPRFFTDPRVRSSSKGVTLGAGAWAHKVTDQTDLPSLMQRVKGIGSTGVKLYYDIDQELATRIAQEAKKAGIQVWSHWKITPSTELETVEAGIQVVSHASFIGRQGRPRNQGKQSAPKTVKEVLQNSNLDLLLRRMRDKGSILDPTLAVMVGRSGRSGNSKLSPLAITAAVTHEAYQAGVKVAAGSDSHGNAEVCGGHLEFRLLNSEAKLSPAEVLNSAAVINAEVLGQSKSIGQLKVGKQSTFLIYENDPLKSVKSWATPKYVIKRGAIYSGEQLRDLNTKARPLRSFK